MFCFFFLSMYASNNLLLFSLHQATHEFEFNCTKFEQIFLQKSKVWIFFNEIRCRNYSMVIFTPNISNQINRTCNFCFLENFSWIFFFQQTAKMKWSDGNIGKQLKVCKTICAKKCTHACIVQCFIGNWATYTKFGL